MINKEFKKAVNRAERYFAIANAAKRLHKRIMLSDNKVIEKIARRCVSVRQTYIEKAHAELAPYFSRSISAYTQEANKDE